MPVIQSQRIKSLSTRYLGLYKYSVLVVLVGVMLFFIFAAVQAFRGDKLYVSPITTTIYFGFLTYGWIRINRNVYQVEFDEKYLYVILRSQDIVIPLENIKEVEIKTLGGVYEVELYTAEQLGKKFYFKPSLLYPFNYKRKDDLVNVLRKYINQAQARKQHFQGNALHS